MDSLQMEFLELCSMGDVNQVIAMLKSGKIDPTYKHKINGWSALHWAARRGHTDVVYQLLNAGFDPYSETTDGKTALDVAHTDSDAELRALLGIECEAETVEAMSSGTENSAPESPMFVPSYKKNPAFPYAKKSASFDQGGCTVGPIPDSPTSQGYYSYGRRDSVNRTRFLLVRTSCANGKEAFKRITLPGGGTVEFLKITIERSMRMGAVKDVLLLPDRVLVEHDEQLSEFADCQKVEVVFDPDAPLSPPQPSAVRKASLTDRMDRRSPSKIPMLNKKSKSVVEDKSANGRDSVESTPSPTPQKIDDMMREPFVADENGHDAKDDADDESSDLSSSLTLSERDEFVSATIKLDGKDSREEANRNLSESPTATTSFTTSAEESQCAQQFVKPLTEHKTETIVNEPLTNVGVTSEPIEELDIVNAESEAQMEFRRKVLTCLSFTAGVAGFSAIAYMCYLKFKRV